MSTRRAIAVWLCALAGALACANAPALAARGWEFEKSFGGAGTGDGEFADSGGFPGPTAVAVDESTGDAYVVDTEDGRVEWFGSSGSYLGQFNGSGAFEVEGRTETGPAAPDGQLVQPHAIAVDNSTDPLDPSKGDVYVTDNDQAGPSGVAIDKFSATGEYLGQIDEASGQPFGILIRGVAVAPSGEVWVDYDGPDFEGQYAASFTDAVVNESAHVIGPDVPFLERGSLGWGLAVDAQDDLYLPGDFEGEGGFFEGVEKVSDTGVLLNGLVGGSKVAADWVAVESSTGDAYLSSTTTVGRFGPSGELLEDLGAGHLTQATGLAVNSASASSSRLYVADAAADAVDIFALERPGRPSIESESVSEITSDSATLAAEIDPRSENAERDTSYHFEYGACASPNTCAASAYDASAPIPAALLGPDFEVDDVGGVHPQDLMPHTTYHFRVVAENARGLVAGEERTFTTQTAGGPLVLPDARAWELVSPVDKRSALIEPIGEAGLDQASVGGGEFSFLASLPTEPEPQGYAQKAQVLSSRGAEGEWSSVDIALSHSAPVGVVVGYGYEYRFFSEDLALGVAESFGPFSSPEGEHENARQEAEHVSEASPEATERTPYLRHDLTCATEQGTCYTPLVTGAPECPDVPEGTEFGGSSHVQGDVEFVGATPDAAHVVLASSVKLTPIAASDEGLYEWTAGMPCQERLLPVSLLPTDEGGKAAVDPGLGRKGMARHALSDDGARIFFSAGNGLYMRDTTRGEIGETIRLDLTESGSAGAGTAAFQTASTDGSRAFFTDSSALTGRSGKEGRDLYECAVSEVGEVDQKLGCGLSDLTPEPVSGQAGAGESARVQGSVLGAGEDGDYVYFVADGVLAEGASPGDCGGARAGETCNLYVAHLTGDEWTTSFIATLSGDDSPDWSNELARMTARVSPNGEWLAFMSDRSLTGYDNRDALSGESDEEVYLYQASTGALVCASCDPTNARPQGVEYKKLDYGLAGGKEVWAGSQWLAANIPGWTSYSPGEALYQSRYLSNGGRLFFNSSDALVPQDINGNEDVYEYEPPGAGNCTNTAATFSERSGGCVGLISSGVAHGESAFLDASESGGDVFFLTAEELVPQDVDTALDVYDAHECTVQSPCALVPVTQPAPCASAASCRAAPAPEPPIYGAPSSATFAGVGNVISPPTTAKTVVKPKAKALTRARKLAKALHACVSSKSSKRQQRARCERAARRRYGPAKSAREDSQRSSRASAMRRAGR
jgi:hypothetical protein